MPSKSFLIGATLAAWARAQIAQSVDADIRDTSTTTTTTVYNLEDVSVYTASVALVDAPDTITSLVIDNGGITKWADTTDDTPITRPKLIESLTVDNSEFQIDPALTATTITTSSGVIDVTSRGSLTTTSLTYRAYDSLTRAELRPAVLRGGPVTATSIDAAAALKLRWENVDLTGATVSSGTTRDTSIYDGTRPNTNGIHITGDGDTTLTSTTFDGAGRTWTKPRPTDTRTRVLADGVEVRNNEFVVDGAELDASGSTTFGVRVADTSTVALYSLDATRTTRVRAKDADPTNFVIGDTGSTGAHLDLRPTAADVEINGGEFTLATAADSIRTRTEAAALDGKTRITADTTISGAGTLDLGNTYAHTEGDIRVDGTTLTIQDTVEIRPRPDGDLTTPRPRISVGDTTATAPSTLAFRDATTVDNAELVVDNTGDAVRISDASTLDVKRTTDVRGAGEFSVADGGVVRVTDSATLAFRDTAVVTRTTTGATAVDDFQVAANGEVAFHNDATARDVVIRNTDTTSVTRVAGSTSFDNVEVHEGEVRVTDGSELTVRDVTFDGTHLRHEGTPTTAGTYDLRVAAGARRRNLLQTRTTATFTDTNLADADTSKLTDTSISLDGGDVRVESSTDFDNVRIADNTAGSDGTVSFSDGTTSTVVAGSTFETSATLTREATVDAGDTQLRVDGTTSITTTLKVDGATLDDVRVALDGDNSRLESTTDPVSFLGAVEVSGEGKVDSRSDWDVKAALTLSATTDIYARVTLSDAAAAITVDGNKQLRLDGARVEDTSADTTTTKLRVADGSSLLVSANDATISNLDAKTELVGIFSELRIEPTARLDVSQPIVGTGTVRAEGEFRATGDTTALDIAPTVRVAGTCVLERDVSGGDLVLDSGSNYYVKSSATLDPKFISAAGSYLLIDAGATVTVDRTLRTATDRQVIYEGTYTGRFASIVAPGGRRLLQAGECIQYEANTIYYNPNCPAATSAPTTGLVVTTAPTAATTAPTDPATTAPTEELNPGFAPTSHLAAVLFAAVITLLA
jgi:hypothetical protein